MRTTRRLSLAALALLLAAACNDTGAAQVAGPTATPPVVTTPAAPVVTDAPTTAPTTQQPSSSPTASPSPARPSYDVKSIQRQLAGLFYLGPIDGEAGAGFASAVAAFQKVNGLYGDGVVGKKTLAALKSPAALPKLKGSGSGVRVEVDLTRQVLYLVKDNRISEVLAVSSGSGAHYFTKSGHRATALTPVGHYVIQRRIVGVRVADLGTLYDPEYFYKGWAIHGSGSVPGYPASHGCIRVSRANGTWLLGQIGVGTHVYVYGGTHVFQAGSTAPGTDDPGGDTGSTPAPTASPTGTPTAKPTAKPTPKPTPKASPTPTPSRTP
ncbi:MAG: heavy metal translocating P-type ATPase [Frankiales bacterium]|nr:heavy metal translocating P-type ATPase [Frankiales bacterium]